MQWHRLSPTFSRILSLWQPLREIIGLTNKVLWVFPWNRPPRPTWLTTLDRREENVLESNRSPVVLEIGTLHAWQSCIISLHRQGVDVFFLRDGSEDARMSQPFCLPARQGGERLVLPMMLLLGTGTRTWLYANRRFYRSCAGCTVRYYSIQCVNLSGAENFSIFTVVEGFWSSQKVNLRFPFSINLGFARERCVLTKTIVASFAEILLFIIVLCGLCWLRTPWVQEQPRFQSNGHFHAHFHVLLLFSLLTDIALKILHERDASRPPFAYQVAKWYQLRIPPSWWPRIHAWSWLFCLV